MSDLGITAAPESLNLWRNRDFRWQFQNVNDAGTAEPFPAGDLFFEIQTGGEHNALQEVSLVGASGGTYKLGVLGTLSDDIDYYDVTENPYGMDGDIKDALEAIPAVGAGNVDVYPASLYPAWAINIELNESKNEIQVIKFKPGTHGGEFKVGFGLSNITDELDFGLDEADLQTAIQGLSGIGASNATVTKISDYEYRVEFVGALAETNVDTLQVYGLGIGGASFIWGLTGFLPGVTVETVTDGLVKLTEPLVNVINTTVNDIFDSFETLLGVDIDFSINDARNATLIATSRRAYVESDIITFTTDITSNMIKNAINNVANLAGLLDTVVVDFYWNHIYQVEFIGELANTPIPAMTYDTTSLTGPAADPVITTTVIEPGKDPITVWSFDIDDALATIKVESEEVALVPNRSKWQLVFLPDGEPAGGDPEKSGIVRVQG